MAEKLSIIDCFIDIEQKKMEKESLALYPFYIDKNWNGEHEIFVEK